MKFKMDSKGVDTYISALKNRLKHVKDQLANEIKQNLEIYSPKRTGKLASSYEITTSDDKIQISNDCGYCRYVNDGTIYQAGQHFIEQSVSLAEKDINKIVEKTQIISK